MTTKEWIQRIIEGVSEDERSDSFEAMCRLEKDAASDEGQTHGGDGEGNK